MSSARDSADGTTSKGQVTIPKALRQQFGLARGSRVRLALGGITSNCAPGSRTRQCRRAASDC
ncbi:MAG: AbrB/MazE/SpoVT family DNA-binding domain-containing protein [Cyanobium sp.]